MAILGFNKTAIIFFHFCNLEINFPEKGGLSLPSFSLCPSGGGTHVVCNSDIIDVGCLDTKIGLKDPALPSPGPSYFI